MKMARDWLTAITIGAFFLMAVTGLLMFFHKAVAFNRPAHEWLSWAFVAGVVGHVVVNWASFKRYFKTLPGIGVIVLFLAVLGASFYPWGGGGQGGRGPGRSGVDQVVLAAPLPSVAALQGISPEALVARFGADGIKVDNPEASLRDIARANNMDERQLLGKLFPPTEGGPGGRGGRPPEGAPDRGGEGG